MEDNDVTLPVLLTSKLWEYEGITFSGYYKEHPLVPKIEIVVKGVNVKNTLKKMVRDLKKDFEEIVKVL